MPHKSKKSKLTPKMKKILLGTQGSKLLKKLEDKEHEEYEEIHQAITRGKLEAAGILEDEEYEEDEEIHREITRGKLEAAGILEDDRQKYKLGKVVSKLLGKGKKKSKAKDSEDVDTILSKMSDEELDTLTDIDKKMLLDMQLEKWGIEGLEGLSFGDIDKILANMPASEIARLTKADIDMLLDLESDKLYREGLVAGGLLSDNRQQYKLGKLASKIMGKSKQALSELPDVAIDAKDAIKMKMKGSESIREKIKITEDAYKDSIKNYEDLNKSLKRATSIDEEDAIREMMEEESNMISRLTRQLKEMGVEPSMKNFREEIKKPRRFAEGGPIDEQMDTVMQTETVPSAVETHTMPDGTEMPGATHEEYEASMPDMESDDVMEDDYLEFVLEEALTPEEQSFLTQELEQNTQLATIFDKVIDVAQEFAGSGPVEGPGSGTSDSIPARLSDGEFVFTAEAVEEIGADNLQQMMEAAEASADQRQSVANGGYMNGDDEYNRRQPLTEEEQLLDMQRANPRRFYRPISG